MANIRRWMAEARALEEAGDLRGAVALHQKALAAQEETTGFGDLGLYNGLGDLYLRSGDVSRAVAAFEEAAAVCEEQQLYANGIALCKKILRNSPGHAGAHRRAGRLLAASGLGAEARGHYERYIDLVDRAGRPGRAEEALRELVSLTADDVASLRLADRLVESGRTEAALEVLRATRERREETGRDVVEIVRRIQEIQPTGWRDEPASAASPPTARRLDQEAAGPAARPGPPVPGGETSTPPAEGRPVETGASAARGPASAPEDDRDRAEDPAEAEDDVAALMRELEEIVSGLDSPERFRHALSLLDQLLEFQPDRFELLHRKLAYAHALGDEATTVDAYLALGRLLDRRLSGFSIRSLSSSTPSGDATTALEATARSEEAGASS